MSVDYDFYPRPHQGETSKYEFLKVDLNDGKSSVQFRDLGDGNVEILLLIFVPTNKDDDYQLRAIELSLPKAKEVHKMLVDFHGELDVGSLVSKIISFINPLTIREM